MSAPRGPRHRPLAEQYEQWMAHLRRHGVSRRAFTETPVGAAAGDFVLGSGSGSGPAAAAAVASAGTIADGFLVNGRHLSYGDDPRTQMWVGGQLFNVHTYNAVPPKSLRVWLEYGADRSYGMTVEAEIRELISHVPVWDGKPGALHASRMLNADQFFVHAHLTGLAPGTEYHYRFRYATAGESGATSDATFMTVPDAVTEPFTFTAFGDEGIPGTVARPGPVAAARADWGMWNNGSFEPTDPDDPASTGHNTTSAVIKQIMRVRNLANGTPSRFNLQAGDLCYAQAQGRHPADHQPGRPQRQPAGARQHAGAAADQRRLGLLRPVGLDELVPDDRAQRGARSRGCSPPATTTPSCSPRSVAADQATVDELRPLGYGGLAKRLDLPATGPSGCPSVYSFRYGNVGIISLDANELCLEIQGLTGYSGGAQAALAGGTARGLARATRRSTSSSRSSTSARSPPATATAPTAACARRSPRCSPGTRSTWRSRATTTSTSAPTRCSTTPATNSARSTRQAVAVSPDEPAEVEPARDGTTYVVVGTAGTPRYGWTGGARDRPQLRRRAGQRHDRHRGPAAKTGPYVAELDFSKTYETVDWSQARYDDYGFIALDVTPGAARPADHDDAAVHQRAGARA